MEQKHGAIKQARKLMGFSPDVLDMYEELNPELLEIMENLIK